ncbi:MAG: hypothetical protein IJT73_03595 [Selenomonadaceae bacterium]|nr:hypothetical protein [Selenomonadaceae bacterium]
MWKKIKSLGNLYELNEQGEARNSITGELCNYRFRKDNNPALTFRIKGKYVTRAIHLLLNEVFGFPKKMPKPSNAVTCTATKRGKTYKFNTLVDCARFLAPISKLKSSTICSYLANRQEYIGGYTITYEEKEI